MPTYIGTSSMACTWRRAGRVHWTHVMHYMHATLPSYEGPSVRPAGSTAPPRAEKLRPRCAQQALVRRRMCHAAQQAEQHMVACRTHCDVLFLSSDAAVAHTAHLSGSADQAVTQQPTSCFTQHNLQPVDAARDSAFTPEDPTAIAGYVQPRGVSSNMQSSLPFDRVSSPA